MDRNFFLLIGGLLAFFAVMIWSMIIQGDIRDAKIVKMVEKGVNPIVARCSIDQSYAGAMNALCLEALKKEAK